MMEVNYVTREISDFFPFRFRLKPLESIRSHLVEESIFISHEAIIGSTFGSADVNLLFPESMSWLMIGVDMFPGKFLRNPAFERKISVARAIFGGREYDKIRMMRKKYSKRLAINAPRKHHNAAV